MGTPYREKPANQRVQVRTYDHVLIGFLLLVVGGLAYLAGGAIALGGVAAVGVGVYAWRVMARQNGLLFQLVLLAVVWALFVWDFRLDLRTAMSAVILLFYTVMWVLANLIARRHGRNRSRHAERESSSAAREVKPR